MINRVLMYELHKGFIILVSITYFSYLLFPQKSGYRNTPEVGTEIHKVLFIENSDYKMPSYQQCLFCKCR
jgi:hypothetical protein